MRLEKNWPTWYRELRPIYGPYEADAGRFVDLKKNDFIGREAAAREKEEGGKLRRVTFIVDAADADVLGDEPIWHDGQGGRLGHLRRLRPLRRPLARAGLRAEGARGGRRSGFEIEILGERRPARIQAEPLFDPEGARMRG